MKKIRLWLCLFALLSVVACSNTDGESAPSAAGPASNPELPATSGDGEIAGSAKAASPGSMSSSSAPVAASSGTASSTPLPSAPSAGPPSSTPGFAPPASGEAADSPASALPIAPTLPPTDTAIIPPPSTRPVTGQTAAGTLTAGAWDDNRNFERFMSYRASLMKQRLPGLLPTTDDEHASAHDEFSTVHGARQTLDVAIVLDTTGSMGDEIRYLQTEFLALSHAIEANYPNSMQRWSLVVYKDTSDEYITRWFDFRDNADDFREKLALQSAGGGGDFPEAPDAAFAAMVGLDWRTDKNTARLAFWVADAPHHDEKAVAMAAAIRAARSIDVHVYPVASSGINEFTELTMRSAAQLTGGRYLFLTNDSGVGGAHKEPSIPCYFVTHLDDAILRMVDIELSGTYREPDAAEIVRRGGNPQDGACTLESGTTVQIF